MINWAVLFAALAAVVIFGGSAVATKVAVSAIAAIDVAILRTIIGGSLAIPLAFILRIGLPQSILQRGLLLLSGFSGFIAFPLLFTFGVGLTSANHATMILAMLPLLTGAIAMSWDRQRPRLLWWSGCAIAFAGEILLIYEPVARAQAASLGGDMLVLASTLFASLGYVAGAYAWSGLLYQAIGVTIVAYILWYWALGSGGIARVGLFQFLQPVSGVILAWLILAEKLSLNFVVASLIIMLGVFLAYRAR